MANKIQLRRDTTANWARVNPILDDGEPGLDITTNQVKYGDGANAWVDLSYASGGGGGDSIVNGNYSVSVGANGVVTMETSRGSLEFGALPEPGGPSHFHIMRASGDNADLYFGDDFNYMLQRGPALGQTPGYGVEIGTNDNDSGSQHVWRFETDGTLTLPGDLHGAEIFETSPTGPISAGHQLNITPASNATDKKFEFAINQNSSGVFQNAALQLPTSENNKQVYLSFPGHDSGDSSSSIVSLWNQNTNSGSGEFNNAFNILANGKDIKLTAEDSIGSYSTWTFDSSGTTTFPNSSTFNGVDFVAKENDELNLTILDSSAYIGVTQSNNLTEPAAYMDVYFGKKSRIRTTSLDNQTEYDWYFNPDGSLTLPIGGEIKTAAGTGSVAIEANDGNNTRTWTFGTNGSLTFPDTTTQSTAYKRTTGSWTVATGSGTYSFTVPLNGTYTMWVRGNIPDGIVVWNATATVTNNNVPVIGQQFAWNYTGAGTPIEITAMPTQFVGTVNTIVSSNPSVGSNSNVFNFTINNTSGSAKTVYWGYVTQ